ncbi:MAG: OmpA family protein, partial [Steroidobacteraceae bacterium]
MPDVRVLLDDGTYVPTDEDGQFHFEGVRPGTHVVQLDLDSLPPELEAIPCIQNSRFAGRSFSQFVEAQGGSLWRTDFYVRRRAGQVGIRLQATLVNERAGGFLDFLVELDGGQVWTEDLLATVRLPDGVSYSPGSTRIDGIDGVDPQIADGFATFRLGDPGVNWRRVIEFKGRAAGAVKGGGLKEHTLRAQFDSGKASLKPEAVAEADRLITQLHDTSIKRIEVVGHTDSQPIAPGYRKVFRDNDALSQARARTAAQALAEGLGLSPDQVSTAGKGAREPLASNDTPAGMARNRRVEVTVVNEEAPTIEPMACPSDGLVSKAVANFATPSQPGVRTPMVESRLSCSDPTMRTEDDSSRKSITVTGPGAAHDADAAYQQARMKRRAIPDDPEAAGANIDWLSNQAPGTAWLFPAPDHSPRAPTQRIAIKHGPNQTVVLKYKGQPVHPLNFDGIETNAAKTVSVSVWRGLPLSDGDNRFDADVLDERGATVATLTRSVHYANMVARAVLVPEE